MALEIYQHHVPSVRRGFNSRLIHQGVYGSCESLIVPFKTSDSPKLGGFPATPQSNVQTLQYGSVAQLAEHAAHNRKDIGSRPIGSTSPRGRVITPYCGVPLAARKDGHRFPPLEVIA